jgi:RHS repeat-associated protein
MNSGSILITASIILAIFGLVTNVFPADVKIIQDRLYVEGEHFVIKGVNYSPVPIGADPEITPPYGDYFTAQHSPIYERDLPLLREMGANTVRLRSWNTGVDHSDFLNKAYNNGIRPIYVVLTFPIGPVLYPDISSPGARKRIKADFRAMVKAHKHHPAILMWSIGDELNNSKMYGGRLKEIFSLINEMASEAHAEEGTYFHPVTTPLADIDLINTINANELLTPDLDIWGANVYRGASFGPLFSDFKKVSTKPLLITGFGIDAYDENSGEEYENIGEPYQATYAESLWKEVQANQDVCLGGIIRSYSDEWWLGKFGNTLEGCPDLDSSHHSACGHPSTSDPDGFVNDEWFGMMRVKENGPNLDILEPRKVYSTLRFLWTAEETSPSQRQARVRIPHVMLSVNPLDLTRGPTTEEIMAAGQLGGQLYATREAGESAREKRINLSFGEAIEAWNNHEYKQAVKLFKKHMDDYPDSPWASEAVLHVGCDAQYNGRYTEAEKSFKWILEKNKDETYEGAKRLLNKARLRLGVLKVYQNNFKEAKEYFTILKKEGSDWRDRTYASHWIQRLSRYSANKLAMLNCGTQAIAHLLERDGRGGDARRVLEELPESEPGHTIKALSEIALRYGYSLSAIRVSPSELKDLSLPAILHINGKNEGDSGHYWILESMTADSLELFDPQSSLRFEQKAHELLNDWSGNALVFSDKEDLPGTKLAENEMEELYGGCCGVPAPEAQLGDSCWRYSGPGTGNNSPYGSPYWKVNMVNMNLYVNDIPLWYRSKRGPSVYISLSYSSQSAIAYNEPFGNKWMFNYGSYLVVDTAGNVTVFMPDGKRHVYTKTADGYNRPYQVFNKLTKILGNHYRLKFPNGAVYDYNIPPGTRSQQPFLVKIQDSHGRKLEFGYDSNVRLTTITDVLGRVTTLTYNDQGLATLVKDPFGREAVFEYDESRNLVRITDMAGHSSTLSYDEDVYLTGIENERGKWGFYIEPADGLSAPPYPAPGAAMWENCRITVTNPLGDKEEYYYAGDLGSYSYYVSPKHYLPYSSSVNNYNSAPKTYYYLTRISSNGEIGKITDPEGVSVSFIYDTAGNRIGIKDGKGNTTSLTYDPTGNVLTITDPLGNQVQLFYDIRNHLTHLIDPEGNDYYFDYSGYDLVRIRDPKKWTTRFTYTIYDQLKSLVDANDHSTNFGYDSLGNLESVTNPLGGQEIYGYDNIGRVISYTDSKVNTTSYTRDELGRITEIKYHDGSIKTYTYDCCRLTNMTDSNGTMSFNYDTIKRLSSLTDIYGNSISYGYDKNGNLTTLTYPDGKIVTYEYDKADRLTKVKDWLNNVTTYGYDSIGNVVKTSYPDGSVITYHYDEAYRLKSIVDMNSECALNALFKYELDPLGNRKTISFYQPMNSIPGQPNVSYSYEKDNRLLTAGSTTFSYDDNGNLIKKTSGSDATEYAWSYRDMLSGMVHGGDVYSYFYDGLGSRIARIENSVETRYVVTPGLLSTILAETTAGGEITDYYVYGFGLISKVTSSGESYYYHYDGIGSTVGMSDFSGNVVNRYAYDAFGKVLNQEETIPNPFKYVGQFGVMDEGNGLLYMRARYYDPEIGRFINKDPIGLLGGLNMYSYVANNPVSWIDPEGLEIFVLWGRPWWWIYNPRYWRPIPEQKYGPFADTDLPPWMRPNPNPWDIPPGWTIPKPQPKPDPWWWWWRPDPPHLHQPHGCDDGMI